MKNLKLFFLLMLLPFIGSAQYIGFAMGRDTDTAKTNGSVLIPKYLRMPTYGTADTNKVLGVNAAGLITLRTKGTDTTIDTASLSTRIDARVKYTDTAAMLTNYARKTQLIDTAAAIQTRLNAKQATLVSGTNIKTVGGVSLLGSGDISVGGTGTLTDMSVVTANGLAGTVANSTSTPAITLSTTVTGLLKGNGTAISSASAGTDYLTPTGSAAGLTSFPTFNQNTTGNAGTATALQTARNINGVAFDGTANITVTAAAGTLSGSTLASGVTASSLTSFGASPTTTGTLTNDYVSAKQYAATIQTLSDGATTTWNANNGCQAIWTIGGTGRTLTITNPIAGVVYLLKLIQGTGGSKTITTYPTNTRWSGNVAPTLSTAAGAVDIISFWYDGTDFNGQYSLDVR